jgi:hypothetical protein
LFAAGFATWTVLVLVLLIAVLVGFWFLITEGGLGLSCFLGGRWGLRFIVHHFPVITRPACLPAGRSRFLVQYFPIIVPFDLGHG